MLVGRRAHPNGSGIQQTVAVFLSPRQRGRSRRLFLPHPRLTSVDPLTGLPHFAICSFVYSSQPSFTRPRLIQAIACVVESTWSSWRELGKLMSSPGTKSGAPFRRHNFDDRIGQRPHDFVRALPGVRETDYPLQRVCIGVPVAFGISRNCFIAKLRCEPRGELRGTKQRHPRHRGRGIDRGQAFALYAIVCGLLEKVSVH